MNETMKRSAGPRPPRQQQHAGRKRRREHTKKPAKEYPKLEGVGELGEAIDVGPKIKVATKQKVESVTSFQYSDLVLTVCHGFKPTTLRRPLTPKISPSNKSKVPAERPVRSLEMTETQMVSQSEETQEKGIQATPLGKRGSFKLPACTYRSRNLPRGP